MFWFGGRLFTVASAVSFSPPGVPKAGSFSSLQLAQPCLLSFFLLVQWTPFPCAGAIAGVQGRYLIAPFMFLGFATEYTWVVSRAHETRNVRVILSLALIAYGVLSIVATQSATLSRYWIS